MIMPSKKDLIDAIQTRSREEVAEVSKRHIGQPNLLKSVASEEMILASEQRLGFGIQPLLRELYLKIGNGGFGPGSDVFGVEGGRPSSFGHLAETYSILIGYALNDPHPPDGWHKKLLPFVEYGCNEWGVVDCSNGDIYYLDNETEELLNQGYQISDYFQMWIDGKRLH